MSKDVLFFCHKLVVFLLHYFKCISYRYTITVLEVFNNRILKDLNPSKYVRVNFSKNVFIDIKKRNSL